MKEAIDIVNGFHIRPGQFRWNGAFQSEGGVNFTISSHGAESCTLLLFHPREAEPFAEIPFPQGYRVGDTYSMQVYGLNIEEFEYAYRFTGPNDPKKGLLFDPANIILDPYARAVTGQRKWGEKPEGSKAFTYKARVVNSTFDWGATQNPNIPIENLVIYETHVRGFSKDPSSDVKAKGTFRGLREKIPYLKDLGINAVELLPVFEFDEIEKNRIFKGHQLYNYWGYNTVSFFAPNTGYAYEEEHNHEGDELKELIRELHRNGIEVILDVVFNHTAEGNEDGSIFSFKGIDNNIYYMLDPDFKYQNFSGTGNCLNCNHPVVRTFIMDCLRYWTTEYRIDGFRFDLASILSRDQNGSPMANPPILEAMAHDSILSRTKLIAEAWDAGGLYQVGSFPSWNRWAEWNGKYRDDMRCFLKGDGNTGATAITRMTGSADLYSKKQGHRASVNFLTCHDGFTLYDLYSYNTKHNLENGWNGTDGDNNGHSWNCDVEGETKEVKVNNLRHRMVKNAFAALFCSRGAAMFLSGDEFCNTQSGNNNAYCQDNEISWLDWNRLKEFREVHDFVRFMISFRKKHPILMDSTSKNSCGLDELSSSVVNISNPAEPGYDKHMIGILYAGRNSENTDDDIVYYCMNSFWKPLNMKLPKLPNGKKWKVAANTYCEYKDGADFGSMTEWHGDFEIRIPARTTMILTAE